MDLNARTFDPLLNAVRMLVLEQDDPTISKPDVIDFIKQSLLLFESGDIYFRRLWTVIETWWVYCEDGAALSKVWNNMPDFFIDKRLYLPFDELDFVCGWHGVQKSILKNVVHDPAEREKIILGWDKDFVIDSIVEKERDLFSDSLIGSFRATFSSQPGHRFIKMLFYVFSYAAYLSALGYGYEEIIGMLEN